MLKGEISIGSESLRHARVTTDLKHLFSQLFGLNINEIDLHVSFLEMGADSLSLLRASQSIQEKFGVKIPFRMLLEELSTMGDLADHLVREMSIDTVEVRDAQTEIVDDEIVNVNPQYNADQIRDIALPSQMLSSIPFTKSTEDLPDTPGVEYIFVQQLDFLSQQMKLQAEIMLQQIELLRSQNVHFSANPPPIQAEVSMHRQVGKSITTKKDNSTKEETINVAGQQFIPENFVAYQSVKKDRASGLTEKQQKHIDNLITLVTTHTQESKRQTQTYRPVLADSRTSAGFRQTWKEMCYPLVINRGVGSKVIDVDSNEYIDLTMGFGALLFGHSPDFLVDALKDAVIQGVRLGGQSHNAGNAASLMCELTGVERVAFCNSGTEAVMSALRIARTVTGRTKIAMFDGSYHGTFDGVMVKPGDIKSDGSYRAMPLSPGVPQNMIDDILLLGYDDRESLSLIRAHAHELAAVLIEPPRSRRPDVQPKEFLHELRKITSESGVALVFDEVVTGFRFHPGGVQALFGVQADLVAYGKAMGGGVPVAAVAGKASFMDAVDGGMWHYGDSSYPHAETTFFAGTYFKNPLIIAAVTSVMTHLKDSGPKLYDDLNARTSQLADRLNDVLEQLQAPMRVSYLGSLFRFLYPKELKLMELFYYHLLAKGIYICETRNCFLSTAHTDDDVENIVTAVKQTILEMREGEIIPDPANDNNNNGGYNINDPFKNLADSLTRASTATSSSNTYSSVQLSTSLPLTEGQKQLWYVSQISEEASVAYNLSMTLNFRGPLDFAALKSSFQALVNNHEALRITFSADGKTQYIQSTLNPDMPIINYMTRDKSVDEYLKKESRYQFDLTKGPLIRACVIKIANEHHIFADSNVFC